jgi:hypothetical protein
LFIQEPLPIHVITNHLLLVVTQVVTKGRRGQS